MQDQPIPGGSCPISPMQLCIIWAATEEGTVTKLARDVWFAALNVQFWRSKEKPGQPYRPSPRGFRTADIAKVLGVGETKLREPLRELDQAGIFRTTDDGPWFATSLSDLSVPESVTLRIQTMFDRLHPKTRDKLIAVPRRLLKLIVQCRRKTVRLATLLGLLLRIMLQKRTDQYGSYKGCCKAKWIAEIFGVGVDRVKTERRNLIREGWFTEEPTPPHVQKRFGLWLRLSLEPIPDRPKAVDNLTVLADGPTEVEPQTTPKPPELQPLLNPKLPSQEGIFNNQKLSEENPTGVQNNQINPLYKNPTWTNIHPDDLQLPDRRQALFENAVTSRVLRDTEADRLTFFAAIARTLQKATDNAEGFLRRLIERPDYRDFITQTDEDTARQWLGESQAMQLPVPILQTEEEKTVPSLSKDALTVRILTEDLKYLRYEGHPLTLIQRKGYLLDWTRERWDQGALELTHVRGLGQSRPAEIGQTLEPLMM